MVVAERCDGSAGMGHLYLRANSTPRPARTSTLTTSHRRRRFGEIETEARRMEGADSFLNDPPVPKQSTRSAGVKRLARRASDRLGFICPKHAGASPIYLGGWSDR